jgi:hypothetical protein
MDAGEHSGKISDGHLLAVMRRVWGLDLIRLPPIADRSLQWENGCSGPEAAVDIDPRNSADAWIRVETLSWRLNRHVGAAPSQAASTWRSHPTPSAAITRRRL